MRSPPEEQDGFVLRIDRSMTGLRQLGGWVDGIAAALKLESATEYALRLCLEEAAANVVMHGMADGDGDGAFVTLRVEPNPDMLVVTVEDRCEAFDPLKVPSPQRPKSLEAAPIGGLGIHLMRHYARAISYERAGDVNRLRLSLSRATDAAG